MKKKRLSVCLTFDDATFDFYYYVFPLLKKLKIPALLGVPVGYILERSSLDHKTRLDVPYTLAMQEGIYEEKAPFCTWKELEEMVTSGLVEVASHSYSHANLTFPFVNLEKELVQSKKMLEERLAQATSSFIYPFGKYSPALQSSVKKHYPYSFRIGSALNRGWGKGDLPLTRIPGDHLSSPTSLLSPLKMAKYFFKSFL